MYLILHSDDDFIRYRQNKYNEYDNPLIMFYKPKSDILFDYNINR